MVPRRLPPTEVILALLADGLSRQEIAKRYRVSHTAVYLQLRDEGVTPARSRYTAEIPWRVADKHRQAFEARMLRILGKLRRHERGEGPPPGADQERWLRAWLAELAQENTVVGYDRDDGFYYVPRSPDDDPDLPIRRPL